MVSRQYPKAEGSVLITGTSTGIGNAAVKRLAAAGFHVFAGVRNPQDAERVTALALPGCITAVVIDVTDTNSVTAAVERVRAALAEKDSFLSALLAMLAWA